MSVLQPSVERRWRTLCTVVLLVALAIVAVVGQWTGAIDWPTTIEYLTASPHGWYWATALYIPAVLVGAPVSWITGMMGYALGFTRGMSAGLAGGVLGASAAFGVSRYLLRDQVLRWCGSWRLFRVLEHELGQRGVRLIVLARISPVVSCSVLSYLCGATRLGWLRFVGATCLGMAPGSIVYAWIGATVREWTSAESTFAEHPYARALWGVGLLTTVGLVYQLSRAARQALESAVSSD